MDDSTIPAVLEALGVELARLLAGVIEAETPDLGAAERSVRDGMLAIGAHLLDVGVAARGTGKAGARVPCPCGAAAVFAGTRPKAVQTLLGWITVRRAYYACAACGHGRCPLDAALGVARDSHSPGVRCLAVAFGGRLPFAPAAALLAQAAGVRMAPGTIRTATEGLGAARDAAVVAAVARAWQVGLPPVTVPPPDRLYLAMDGVRILGTDGAGREAKVGLVVPVRRSATGAEVRAAASCVASFEPAAAFGRRLAIEAHRRGGEGATEVAVLGDGAAWIWNLAEEHAPGAVQIVDWYHASERVWDLGKALHGDGTAATATWVAAQLARLASGQAATLAAEWRTLTCHGAAAAVRDEQVTYFTNQAARMQYAAYRAAGWDIGSGMVESGCKHLIGAREKGAGMRWSETGANAVAQVRVLLFNEEDPEIALAA